MSAEPRARGHRRPRRPHAAAAPRTAAPRTGACWAASGPHTCIDLPEAATALDHRPIAAPRPDLARPLDAGPSSPQRTAAPTRAGFEAR